MKRDYKLFINDIIDCINKIEKYLKNVSEEDFKKNIQLQDAVIRRFEIIGEATKNIPRALKEKNKHVPWLQMSLFRDVLAHTYYEVTIKRVWAIYTLDLHKIKEAINKITLI